MSGIRKSLKLSITIPTEPEKVRMGDEVSAAVIIEEVEKELSQCFGGCTRIDGYGSWVDGDGELIAEPVAVLYAHTDESLGYVVSKAETIAARVRQDLLQECVLFSIEESYAATVSDWSATNWI